jgi:hypothetical protein
MKHRRGLPHKWRTIVQQAGEVFGGGIYVTGIAPRMQNTVLAGNELKVIFPYPSLPGTNTITESDGNKGTFNSAGYNLCEISAGMEGLVSTVRWMYRRSLTCSQIMAG